ncbi:TKL/RAF protein kinase [Saprolegnia parasitica CBS 223.65]|uniref:TKL/RAF protein kinase n=1 Tax=Saprolegnia parasitica (strain CBS 223.65) TaxID=695850 RepID=A0A067BSQ2_SAPPC|nr:TKL/RAF protein kinase [Saprolegnia parasitica CBS 223.65]KDO21273.1 TKL/RAF protein kinase [Saprolegnia parasitica CBS 223.65]|eukprot:XP_012208017.1 TKL/RAF protein kinase [Saprolegnia parasitica CBS 223.65]
MATTTAEIDVFAAIGRGDIASVAQFLASTGNVNVVDAAKTTSEYTWTLVHATLHAVVTGRRVLEAGDQAAMALKVQALHDQQLAILQLILRCGFKAAEACGQDLVTLPTLAIRWVEPPYTVAFLEELFSPDNDESGITPHMCDLVPGQPCVFEAVQRNNFAALKLIFQPWRRRDDDERGESLLYTAAKLGNLDAFDFLLRQGSDVDRPIAQSQGTPLHVAARQGHLAIVELLLDCGADTSLRDKNGNTPLMIALRRDSDEVIAALMSRDALFAQHDDATNRDAPGSVLHPGTSKGRDVVVNEFNKAHDPSKWAEIEVLSSQPKKLHPVDSDPEEQRISLALEPTAENRLRSIDKGDLPLDACESIHMDASRSGHIDVVDGLLAAWKKGQTELAAAVDNWRRVSAQTLHKCMYPRPVLASLGAIVLGERLSRQDLVDHYQASFFGRKAFVLKGPRLPLRSVTSQMRDEVEAMQCCASPYLQPLIAVIDNGSSEPLATLPSGDALYSPTLLFEYMDGDSLETYLRKKRLGLDVPRSYTPLDVAWVVANALRDLHSRGYFHRNIKSSNIFLSSTHYIRLGDLGSARTMSDSVPPDVGANFWTAPELLRAGAENPYTTASDIYAFGVVLAELDTGDAPYADVADQSRILQQVRDGKLRPKMSANCEPWFRRLAIACMEFYPSMRPSTAGIVAILLAHRGDDAKVASTKARLSATIKTPLATEAM